MEADDSSQKEIRSYQDLLHYHDTTVIALLHTLSAIETHLHPNPFPAVSDDQIRTAFSHALRAFSASLERFCDHVRHDVLARNISPESLATLSQKIVELRDHVSSAAAISLPSVSWQSSDQAVDVLLDLQSDGSAVPRAPLRSALSTGYEVMRLCALFDVIAARKACVGMVRPDKPSDSSLPIAEQMFQDHLVALGQLSSALSRPIKLLSGQRQTSKVQDWATATLAGLDVSAVEWRTFVSALSRLMQKMDSPRGLPDADYHDLNRRLDLALSDSRERSASFQAQSMRIAARSVIEILERGKTQARLPRENLKETVRAGLEVERLVCFHELVVLRERVNLMRAQRPRMELVEWESRIERSLQRVRILPIVDQAARALAEFARSRDVTIDLRQRDDADVHVDPKLLLRAIHNVLQNAVKYNWRLPKTSDRAAWVQVDVIRDGQHVRVNVENWGTPVTTEEVEKGLVFRLGYRGRFASREDPTGTGRGLYDARSILRSFGGTITLSSTPSREYRRPDDYSGPFITLVSLTLPCADPSQAG